MSKGNKTNNYLVQGSVLAIAGLITRLIGLFYRIPLTRIVGAEGMGYYNTAYEIYNLALLLSTYSIPVALSKLISASDSKKEYKNSNRIFRVAALISAGTGLLFSVLIFIFSNNLAEMVKWPSAAVPLRVLAPTILIFSLMGVIRGLFQGKKTMVVTAFSQVIEQIFNALGSIIAALLLVNAYKDTADAAAYGAAGGTAGTLIGAVFGLAFLFLVYFANKEYFRKKEKKDTSGNLESNGVIAKAVVMTMLPIILSQTIYQISGITDNIIFSNIMSGKGYDESSKAILWEAYSNKYKWLYNVPVAVSSAFGVSIVPMLSANFSEGNIDAIREKVASSIKLNMIIAIPSAVGLCFLARPILLLLFNNPEDTLSPRLMMLGGIAVVFFALSTFTNGVLQGINRMRTPVIHAAISLAVHIVLIYLLVEVFDLSVYGMVIGNVSYALLVCILNWNVISAALEYKQEIKTTFLIPLVSALIMGAAGLGIYKLIYLLVPSNTVAVIPALIIAVVLYFALMILFKGISKDEIIALPKGAAILRIAEKMKLI